MKKLAFSALAVFALVGSALAFTAEQSDVLFCDDPNTTGVIDCTLRVEFVTLQETEIELGLQNCLIAPQLPGQPCPPVLVYESE